MSAMVCVRVIHVLCLSASTKVSLLKFWIFVLSLSFGVVLSLSNRCPCANLDVVGLAMFVFGVLHMPPLMMFCSRCCRRHPITIIKCSFFYQTWKSKWFYPLISIDAASNIQISCCEFCYFFFILVFVAPSFGETLLHAR